jgi:hypothetical protein
MKSTTMVICSLCVVMCSVCFAPLCSASGPRTSVPELMTLDGVIHSDSDDTLAFTPDGNTVFFDRSEGSHKTIMTSRRVNGTWSSPQVASFSGRWFDQDPLVAPDGSYVLFDSDRPITPGGKSLTQNYFSGGRVAPGANIWKVKREGDGWGTPVWLGPIVNNDVFIDFASVAADGTLYFIRFDSKAKIMRMWRTSYRDGKYQPPVSAGVGDPAISIHDPAVASDQSFILFDYGTVKGGLGRLSIAFREGDHWSEPMDLGDVINRDIPWGSHLSPDDQTVYFTGQSGIWKLSLFPYLEIHHQQMATK